MYQSSSDNFIKIKSSKLKTGGLKLEKEKEFKIDRKDARKDKTFGRYSK